MPVSQLYVRFGAGHNLRLRGRMRQRFFDAAEQGEDHAKSVYEDALKVDISTNIRGVVQRQYEGIRAAHDEVNRLRDSVQNLDA